MKYIPFSPQDIHAIVMRSLTSAILFNYWSDFPAGTGFMLSAINDAVMTMAMKHMEAPKEQPQDDRAMFITPFAREIGGYVY